MHVYCVVCKEHLGEIEPLEDGTALEGICPQCRKLLIKQEEKLEKETKVRGFKPDEEEPKK